jgi:hypothetical protein
MCTKLRSKEAVFTYFAGGTEENREIPSHDVRDSNHDFPQTETFGELSLQKHYLVIK